LKNRIKRAKKIKISITDKEKHINIPAIPFCIISFLVDLGFGIGAIAVKFMKDMDEDLKEALNLIDKRDIKLLINELKKYGPFDLVNISEGNRTRVRISIL